MAKEKIELKLRHGLGDALFVTSSLPLFKKNYLHLPIEINTKYPTVFTNNPHVDRVTRDRKGFAPTYIDPISEGFPDKHHIVAVWESICTEYGLETEEPPLQPEIYTPYWPHPAIVMKKQVGVQTTYPEKWHQKKIWPHCMELSEKQGFASIPAFVSLGWDVGKILSFLSSFQGVITAEGGTAHLCKAINIPCVVIYGGFGNPEWTGYPDQLNITSSTKCSPCYNTFPCESDHECMNLISVEKVVRESEQFFESWYSKKKTSEQMKWL